MDELVNRVHDIIDVCWRSFIKKVGNGLIEINKEASMQLHFAFMLKQTIDLIIHHRDESISLELEPSIHLVFGHRECDIVIRISKGDEVKYIPIEIKCYKQYQPNGNLTSGYTQFRDGVYVDLFLLEQYATIENHTQGISFVITNYGNLVNRNAHWRKDISNGTVINGGVISNENYINLNPEFTELNFNYRFDWITINNWHFLKLKAEGQ